MTCRLTVLGGSAVSTVQLIDALADWPGGQARRPDGLELVLHGRSGRVEAVTDACRMRAAAVALPVSVRGERDLAAALDGADLVLNQIRAGGLQARSVDESFPQEFGIPGEETMGPGGLACTVRTIGALRPIWAQVAHRRRRRSSSTSPTRPASSSRRRGLRPASASSRCATRRSACSTALPAGSAGPTMRCVPGTSA